jgi:hypothetical protein
MGLFNWGKKDEEDNKTEDTAEEDTEEETEDEEEVSTVEKYGTNERYCVIRNPDLDTDSLFLAVEAESDYKLISIFESVEDGWVFVMEKKTVA